MALYDNLLGRPLPVYIPMFDWKSKKLHTRGGTSSYSKGIAPYTVQVEGEEPFHSS